MEESPLNDSFLAAGEILQKLAANQMTYDTKIQKKLGSQTAMHDLVFHHYGDMLVSKVQPSSLFFFQKEREAFGKKEKEYESIEYRREKEKNKTIQVSLYSYLKDQVFNPRILFHVTGRANAGRRTKAIGNPRKAEAGVG